MTVASFKHGYGRVPYFCAFGRLPNHWKGRKVGWGVSMNKLWLTQFRDFLMTLLAQAAAKDVGTPIVEERDALAADYRGEDTTPDGPEPDKVALNAYLHLPPGVKLRPLFTETISQNFQTILALTNERIDRVDTPRVSSQIGGGVEGAGFAISQIMAEAKAKHNQFIHNIEAMLVALTEFLWQLVRLKCREVVYVTYGFDAAGKSTVRGWKGLGPDELRNAVDLYWHLDPEQPSAKIVESRYWHERLEATTVDWDTAVSAMGQNPDEVRLGLSRDRIRNGELYQKYLDQLTMQEIGRGDLAEQVLQIEKTGLLPGMPPLPGMNGASAPTDNLQPNQGNLQMAPGGGGAAPISPQTAGIGPGAVVPAAGAGAGLQSIG